MSGVALGHRIDAGQPFGLSRDPFSPTLDPGEAFESRAFRDAREAAMRELRQGARLVALVGAAGTGKTLLLRSLERALAMDGRRVRRVDRGDLAGGAPTADADVLLIDEADRIDDAGLVALSRAVADPAQPAVVLAAVRRRFDHLAGPVLPRTVTLEPLSPTDARELVADRIRRAGGDSALFAPGALSAITYAAAGSPAQLRLFGAAALFQATLDGASRVDMCHARRAIAMKKGIAEDAVAAPEPEPMLVRAVLPVDVSPRAERGAPIEVTAAVTESGAPAVVDAPAEPAPSPEPDPVPVAAVAEPAPPAPDAPAWRRPALAAGGAALLAAVAAFVALRDAPTSVGRTRVEPAPVAAAPPTAAPAPPRTVPLPAREAPTEPPREAAVSPDPEPAPVVAAPVPEPEPAAPVAVPSPADAAPPPAATIVLNYAADQPGAAEAADRVAALLRARGHEVASVRGVPGRIGSASARHEGVDATTVEAVNGAFEQALGAYQPGVLSRVRTGDAAPGTIELSIPDSAAGASRPLRMDRPPG